jgi:hypothetical protein
LGRAAKCKNFLSIKNLLELLQFIPPVHHEFYRSLPHRVVAGKRKNGQTGIVGKEEVVANAEETGTAILETNSIYISFLFVQKLCILFPKYFRGN